MKEISVSEAWEIAEKAALSNLQQFLTKPGEKLLREDFLESENCWFFFRNPDVYVPPEMSLSGDCAYAVSRRGQVRDIADFSGEPERLADYLKVMSDYFALKEA
jgi:hypothetical protein